MKIGTVLWCRQMYQVFLVCWLWRRFVISRCRFQPISQAGPAVVGSRDVGSNQLLTVLGFIAPRGSLPHVEPKRCLRRGVLILVISLQPALIGGPGVRIPGLLPLISKLLVCLPGAVGMGIAAPVSYWCNHLVCAPDGDELLLSWTT